MLLRCRNFCQQYTLKQQPVLQNAEVIEFVRDDHSKFTELSLVFLGDTAGEVIAFATTMHSARCRLVTYSLKIALAENTTTQLSAGTTASHHRHKFCRVLANMNSQTEKLTEKHTSQNCHTVDSPCSHLGMESASKNPDCWHHSDPALFAEKCCHTRKLQHSDTTSFGHE